MAVYVDDDYVLTLRKAVTVCSVCMYTSVLQKWSLLVVSLVTCFLGTASVVSVLVAVLTAINFDGLNLLSQCMLNSTFNTYSITNECPFDPTRIYVSDPL